MKQSNQKFNRAKKIKNDNWKTWTENIINELGEPEELIRPCYPMWLENVLCCCNDFGSNFENYFRDLFCEEKKKNFPSIAKVVLTEYKIKGRSKVLEITWNQEEDKVKLLKGNGDFASKEIINLIKKSSIVITNPPFSKLREFIELLVKLNKKFLIIGPKNACAYRWYFKLWKEGKVGYGQNFNDNFWFQNQKGEWKKFGNIAWHTNMKITKWDFIMGPEYKEGKYPFLENYKECIFVDRASNIPVNYKGLMAVPPSFGYRLNKLQFELIDIIEPVINGERKYTKIIIRNLI